MLLMHGRRYLVVVPIDLLLDNVIQDVTCREIGSLSQNRILPIFGQDRCELFLEMFWKRLGCVASLCLPPLGNASVEVSYVRALRPGVGGALKMFPHAPTLVLMES